MRVLSRACVLLGLICAVSAPALADSAFDAFDGTWTGSSLRRTGDGALGGLSAGALSIEIDASGDEFHARWTAIDWRPDGTIAVVPVEAEFVPTERAAVMRARDIDGDLFDGSDNGNPLDGEPMMWARVEGPVIAIYSLRLAESGAFVLDQFAVERVEGGIAFDYVAVGSAEEELVLQGHFTRAGD